jgi:hypothetical protein
MQPLSPSQINFQKYSGHEKQRVILPQGVPYDWVLDPFFWSHVAKNRLVPFDEIQILPEDGSWIAEFYVVQVGDNWARLALKSKTELHSSSEEAEDLPKGYELKWGGPVIGWSVLRNSERVYPLTKDKKPATKLDAYGWVKTNARNLAA